MIQELSARGQPVGILCVGRTDGPPFSEVETALFRGTSVAAALAISNATLYRVQTEYAAVMQATADAILAVDASGVIRSCNKAATALFSGHDDSLIGRSIVDLAVDAHRDRLREQLDSTLATHQEVSMEMTFASGLRRPVDVLITLSPIGDSIDLHVAVVVHDLTEIKQAQMVISHLASHDPLTDLANRRELNERLAELSRRQSDGKKLAALLYMDVNRFKSVNDTYGHDTGDELLVEVAARLRSAAGDDALVCRIGGGDEFIVVFEDVPSIEDAVAAGNRILQQVQGEPIRCKNVTLYPSLSMGISCLGASARSPEDLLNQADIAMFESKKEPARRMCPLHRRHRLAAQGQGGSAVGSGGCHCPLGVQAGLPADRELGHRCAVRSRSTGSLAGRRRRDPPRNRHHRPGRKCRADRSVEPVDSGAQFRGLRSAGPR